MAGETKTRTLSPIRCTGDQEEELIAGAAYDHLALATWLRGLGLKRRAEQKEELRARRRQGGAK
jgi:hypothetical protein